jgi:hypothetical protein
MAAVPGVRTTILDRFYTQARTDLPGGPLIAVIGKRNNAASASAPDFTPYLATSEQDVITQFGEDSQLHRAFYELSTGGAPRVAFIPLPSNTTFNHGAGTIASATYPTINMFDEAFAAVESVRADIVVPWGRGGDTTDWDDYATPVATPGNNSSDFFYADNSTNLSYSWAKKVADKCSDITYNSYPIIAVMGVAPIPGAETPTPTQLSSGLAFSNLVSKELISTGQFISIVATEVSPISAPSTWGWSNGACLYAALISRLPAFSATSNKPMYNIDKLRYNITRVQAETLSGKGVVCGQLDFTRIPKWVDGTTFAKLNSDFVRLSTIRIVYDAVKLVKSVAQNYVGEGMSITMQNAFQTQISSSLQSMTKLGAINQSDFRVQYSPSENKAYVDLAIVPAFELREVVVQVSVNF